MSKNWVKFSEYLRTALLIAFALPIMALYFDWFKDDALLSESRLNTIKNVAILIYIIVYVIELRIKLKLQSNEIAKLKTKLHKYER